MNRFLAALRVLEVEQHLIEDGMRSFWSFCVCYLSTSITLLQTYSNGTREKIDYKQTLTEKHFSVFTRLREIRKTFAVKDAVPAYVVFTDEELSQIAQLEPITIDSVRKIKGIGDKR